jgi:hypothetical protein
MEELDDSYLRRVKCSAVELSAESRDIDLVVGLVELLYSFPHSLNIVRLHHCTHLFLTVVSYRIIDNLIYFPSSSSSIS